MNILVVGADKGLGNILYKKLRQRGHQVAAGFCDLKNAGGENDVLCLPMDVTNEEQLKNDAEIIHEKFCALDSVVSVAGILLPSDRNETLLTEPLEDIRRQLDVNAVGLVAAFRSFYPIMKRGSRYFAVTSEGGSFTLAGTLFPAYSVSKTAANKFVQVLRLTVGPNAVDLIAVHPGRMNTEMGRTTAQIEPGESAEGFCRLIEGKTPLDSGKNWFIDYTGKPMPV